MRLTLLIFIFIGFSLLSHAQKSKVISVFQLIETEKYEDARKAIEEAITDEKTLNWPRTWYARGYLCQIANDKKKSDLYPDQLYVAYDSYEKALALDPKGRMGAQLAPMYVLLANDFQKLGEKHYNSRKYEDALKAFEFALKINLSPVLSAPIDTNLVYNTALAAYKCNERGKAIGYLNRLHKDKYSPNATQLLFTIFIEIGDTVSAGKVLMEGVERYEDNEDLVLLLVDLQVQTQDADMALDIISKASSKNPDDYIYPYTKGLIYQKMMQYRKAISAYDEALVLDPQNLKIYSNISACFYNIGVEIEENARSITNNRVFLEEKAKSSQAFKTAVDWLEKAHEKNPEDQKVATKLYELYKLLQIDGKRNNIEGQIN